MKFYSVYNGLNDFGAIHLYVIAETKERALELATIKFKEDNSDLEYWSNLEIYYLFDTDKEYTTDIHGHGIEWQN